MIQLPYESETISISIKNYSFERLFPFNWAELCKRLDNIDMVINKRYVCAFQKLWVAMEDMEIIRYIKRLDTGAIFKIVYKIKAGWVTDFASVPKIFRGIVEKESSPIVIPSILHDISFAIHAFTFEQSNDFFLQDMKYYKMNWIKRKLAYLAVSSPVGKIKWRDAIGMDLHNDFVSVEI